MFITAITGLPYVWSVDGRTDKQLNYTKISCRFRDPEVGGAVAVLLCQDAGSAQKKHSIPLSPCLVNC